MLSRDEYRKIKSMSKEEMSRWLGYHNQMMSNTMRKEYNDAYKDELDSSIQNFITAIAYTLHYNDDVHLQHDELASFMYAELTLPEGYTGCYSLPMVDDTYTLEW